nr:MFS transporter [Salmonella enterica]
MTRRIPSRTGGIAHEPWLLWFSCFLSGLGGTLFDPPRSALVVKLIRPEQRGRFFSLLMMQDSAGAVIGALLGSWLLQYDFRLVCATGAILFILCALFNAWLLPAWKLSTVRTPVAKPAARISIPVTIIGFAPKRSAMAPPKMPRPC